MILRYLVIYAIAAVLLWPVFFFATAVFRVVGERDEPLTENDSLLLGGLTLSASVLWPLALVFLGCVALALFSAQIVRRFLPAMERARLKTVAELEALSKARRA